MRQSENKIELLEWKDNGSFIEGFYGMPDPEFDGYTYKPFTILYEELEDWVITTGRLEFLNDTVNHMGEHMQEAGVIDFVDWLECVDNNDILAFLSERRAL